MVPFEQDVQVEKYNNVIFIHEGFLSVFPSSFQGFLRQILEALKFIHDRNIAHLDIKVKYILLCVHQDNSLIFATQF